jgi:hypothetical protein
VKARAVFCPLFSAFAGTDPRSTIGEGGARDDRVVVLAQGLGAARLPLLQHVLLVGDDRSLTMCRARTTCAG